MRHYLSDNALMWFEEYHVDGLRWDMIAYIKSIDGNDDNPANDIPEGWSLMQWINGEIKQRFPGKISIGESMKNNPWVIKEVGAGGAGFNAQWDAEFVHPVRQAIIIRDDASRDLGAVSKAIEHRYDLDVFRRVIYTESHDEVANGRPGCPRRFGPARWIAGFPRSAPRWAVLLFLLRPVSRCFFKGRSYWKIAGSRIKTPSTGPELRTKVVFWGCIEI